MKQDARVARAHTHEQAQAHTRAQRTAHARSTHAHALTHLLLPSVTIPRCASRAACRYYVAGILIYGKFEGWAPFDVAYYLTTTVTTVGYGEFSPSSSVGRWVTSVFAPFGTVAVMSALLPTVEWCLLHVDKMTAWPIAAMENVVAPALIKITTTAATPKKWSAAKIALSNKSLKKLARDALTPPPPRGVSRTSSTHIVEVAGYGGVTYEVGSDWAYVHALMGPTMLCTVGILLSAYLHSYSWCDSVYWTIITMTTVGYGDLVPESFVQKLYTVIFMPVAATTLAATVERFDKLNTAKRIHQTRFDLSIDNLLKDSAIVQQDILPTMSEEAFVLRVLVEENMVEETTLRELRARYQEMLTQAEGKVRGEGKNGKPLTIDAEVVYYLLVQQGRITDSNVHASRAKKPKPPALKRPRRARTRFGPCVRRRQGWDAAARGGC